MLVPGGNGVAQIGGGDGTLGPADGVLYFSVSVRNVGNGMAVLHGWRLSYNHAAVIGPAPPLSEFTLQTRDLYIPVNDTGFWQGAIRDLADPRYEMAHKVTEGRAEWYVDLLYGDYDGGQRTITRFRCQYRPMHGDGPDGPGPDGGKQNPGTWLATVARHWALDQPDPRSSDRAAYQ